MDYDALRAAHPELRISVYGMTPGSVTLEIITPDDMVFPFVAATLAGAIDLAFPQQTCPNTGMPCVPGCTGTTCTGLHVPLNEWPDALTPAFDAPVSDMTPEPNIFD